MNEFHKFASWLQKGHICLHHLIEHAIIMLTPQLIERLMIA